MKIHGNSSAIADSVTYGPAGEMTGIRYLYAHINPDQYTPPFVPYDTWIAETRSYNARGQLTRLTAAGVHDPDGYKQTPPTNIDYEYVYNESANDGRIARRKDWVSGEDINYQYDSLGRLLTAFTTSAAWGIQYGYDGFGNLLSESQVGDKGLGVVKSFAVNAATNRITGTGYSYDTNGNLTAMPQLAMTYDIENRLVKTVQTANGTEQYVYNPWNERVWRKRTDGYEEVYFYGPDGRRLLRVQLQYDATNGNFHMTNPVAEIRLAGKLVSSGDWRYGLVEDQTGTVSAGIYYPYGESKVSPTTGPWRTYPRDSGSGLDYAMNRYYSSFTGRFTTPDPYGPSGGSADPQSWNRYAYSQNDPVNFLDPNGLQRARVCDSYMDWDSSDGVWRARGSVLWCYEGEVGGGGGRFTPPDAGGGTRNAGASSNATNWDLMPKALARALQVLSLNADCAALFGTAESRANGFDPAVILVTLYASPDGGKYGKTTFADLGLNAEGAYERKRGGKVEIVINSSAPTFHQYWNYGNVELNALLMLHEMGHAYADLTGSGGSQIKRDTDWRDRSTPQGEVNNSLIRTKCHLGEP